MLRDRNLVPLSHQHQHVLALCVRLDRALQAGGTIDLEAWQAEIQQIFEHEVGIHFAAEEKHLFPVAGRFSPLQPLTVELVNEHGVLRDLFARAGRRELDTNGLQQFIEALALHVRKEERQLFEGMQQVMSEEDLAALGAALQEALKSAITVCSLPNPATRLPTL